MLVLRHFISSTVSLQDGQVGDTVGGTDLSSVGSGKSTLAMSTADNFIIDGNVAGTIEVVVADPNKGPGALPRSMPPR